MPRRPSNQWDFGDLFSRTGSAASSPAPASPARAEEPARTATNAPAAADAPTVPARLQAWTVSELTSGIRKALEAGFSEVRVSGEISNFRLQASGHAYFVLKDAQSQLSCVLFRGQAGAGVRAALRDGVHVVLGGEITVYEPRGQYQLRVATVELEGVGALQAAFERLKARLAAEGLFEAARKRPIPRFPRRVGLVTSPTGAAIQDVLHVVRRRYAGLEFVLVPVRVQGQGAAEEIAAAVERLNRYSAADGPDAAPRLDVVLVTRGGGSLEDLWAFNEEVVARAIAASGVPVVSAVGHEIDFSIADFVADLRAATPSAAAELLTEAYVASRTTVAEASRRAGWLLRRRMEEWTAEVRELDRRLARLHPRRQLADRAQRLDEAVAALGRLVRRGVAQHRQQYLSAGRRWLSARPSSVLSLRRRALGESRRRIPVAARQRLSLLRQRFAQAAASLRLLSPENNLDRGYSITFLEESGRVVRSPDEVREGDRLRTRVRGGVVASTACEPGPGVA
ncbi:MAG: exodeoxyribonuclease VII large subunit [Verrucomicrobiales bacterium]|nr:exodeoxyribonuclease VII large subunit [Verrucomicrobiales bacterium]